MDPFSNKKNIVIFCQAPADIPYVLTIYEEEKTHDCRIILVVVNVKGMYNFFKEINIKFEEIIFIPYELKNLKKIYKIVHEKKRLTNLWNIHFKEMDNGIVYFFSRFEDWLTANFIYKFSLKEGIKVTYANHYDHSASLFIEEKKSSFKKFVYLLLLKNITGIKFKANIIEKLPEFPIKNYKIKEIEPHIKEHVFQKYKYRINTNISPKDKLAKILFFISPCETNIYNQANFDVTLTKILDILSTKNYRVIIKGHPRLGIPKQIDPNTFEILADYIPGEFIDVEGFDYCIGLHTTAICHYALMNQIPTYSLIKLFMPNNTKTYNSMIDYLKIQSKGTIKFIKSLSNLESALHIKS